MGDTDNRGSSEGVGLYLYGTETNTRPIELNGVGPVVVRSSELVVVLPSSGRSIEGELKVCETIKSKLI